MVGLLRSKDIVPRKQKVKDQIDNDHNDTKMIEKSILTAISPKEIMVLEKTRAPEMEQIYKI